MPKVITNSKVVRAILFKNGSISAGFSPADTPFPILISSGKVIMNSHFAQEVLSDDAT